MKTVVFFLFITSSIVCRSQQYNLRFSLPIPGSALFHTLEWADVDSDSLLDAMVFGASSEGNEVILLFRNDGATGLEFAGEVTTVMKKASFLVTDFDGDNLIDVIMTGKEAGQPATSVFLNQGNFVFQPQALLSRGGDIIRLMDLDGNGHREIVFSGSNNGQPYLEIARQSVSGWTVVHDSITVHASDIESFDFDGDNDLDFFVTGRDETGAPVARAFLNEGGFYFATSDLQPAVAGASTPADLNHDGYFDILLAGKDANDAYHSIAVINTMPGFQLRDTLVSLDSPRIFAADLNSDGSCDISLFGLLDTADTLNAVLTTHDRDTLPHEQVVTQAFGDYERDGDLDLLQLLKGPAAYYLALLENRSPDANRAPGRPYDPIVANIFNRLFVYWEKPSDDHTARHTLTFDVSLQATGKALMTGEFDLFSGRRLRASDGNNGTSNFVLLRSSAGGPVQFSIQAVDNSLYGGSGGICMGSGGGGLGLCSEVMTKDVEGCKNELVSLHSPEPALWFSFTRGFLAETTVLAFQLQQADTVFSVTRRPDGCAVITVYAVRVPPVLTKVSESTAVVCTGQLLRLGVEPGWQEVFWSSAARGFLEEADSIDFPVSVSDTVIVDISNGAGCVLRRKTALQISKPEIGLAHDAYQILQGESVQLHATGGEVYAWQPVLYLDDPRSSSPVASPLKTTAYAVTVTDSIGCSGSAQVIVVVEETAFIPNLFTPNHDGSNDVLKIYGAGAVTDFSFTIYNREGSRVYHTNNLAEAMINGWNGTAGGVDQPPGVYYWTVLGQTGNGQTMRLNGKNSGSIVLVR